MKLLASNLKNTPLASLTEAIHSRTRWIFWGLLFLLFAFTETSGRNDFDIFLQASSALWRGEDIYLITYFDGYHYYYSTLFAILLTPLTWIPVTVAKVLWIAFQVWMLHRLTLLLGKMLPRIPMPKWLPFVLFVAISAVMFRFIKSNIHLGQVTILILWLTTEAFCMMLRNRPLWSGVLLALAIDIKLLPLVMLPYLAYRAQWRSLGTLIATLIALNLLPAILIGTQRQSELLASRWTLINPVQDKHMFDVEETSFHGLSTVIPILCMEDSGDRSDLPYSRNVVDLEPEQVKWVIHGVRLLIILSALWFLRTMPFSKSRSTEHSWWEFSYLLLCVPLIFPHQQHYAFLMAWPAMVWQLGQLINPKRITHMRWWSVALFAAAFLLFNAGLIFGFWRAELEHFKVVTIAGILLLTAHAFSGPEMAFQHKKF